MFNSLAPLCLKQTEYIKRCQESWLNVAHGGKRGAKNVTNGLAFCIALETHPNKLHLVAGYDTSSAKLNILDCDGYGILNYFAGRCHEGKYKNRECLYIDTATGTKILLISGGGKANSYKTIKGNTYGMAYVTEANECHPDFLKEVEDRTLSSDDRKIFHDLNPKSPKHWYYTEYLSFHEEQQKKDNSYGFNYEEFNIFDNLSITNEKLKKRLATYDKKSIWYKRDILGLRCNAEGLIYTQFANNPKLFIRDRAEDENGNKKNLMIISIGVDYGATKGETELKATGITPYFKEAWTIDEEKITGLYAPEDFYKAFVNFYRRVVAEYGKVTHAFADYGALGQVLTFGLNRWLQQERIPLKVDDCIKGRIVDRIYLDSMLFAQTRRFILSKCKYMIEAYEQALWDDKKEDERLDDGTTPVDDLDASEYSMFPFYDKFMSNIGGY